MLFIQTLISISSMVLQNCLFNNVCKRELETNDHIYRFNMIMYIVCIILFGFGVIKREISFFTIALGFLFGVITALSNFYKMRALTSGPMHITLLVTTSSMIIPTMSGIFFKEKFSILKLILVFILITHYKLKGGVLPYVKGFFEPVPIFAPFNIIGEFATPVSMSFRHYGNVLSGVVIATLVGHALGAVSNMVLGWLPGFLGDIPFLQVGLPAILSLYFDIFSGVMQAFIFAMLTMLYIATGFPEEEYERRKAKRNKKALPVA